MVVVVSFVWVPASAPAGAAVVESGVAGWAVLLFAFAAPVAAMFTAAPPMLVLAASSVRTCVRAVLDPALAFVPALPGMFVT